MSIDLVCIVASAQTTTIEAECVLMFIGLLFIAKLVSRESLLLSPAEKMFLQDLLAQLQGLKKVFCNLIGVLSLEDNSRFGLGHDM
jgi:hypothetical protein